MAPNPLAELRAAHPELGISDPPTKADWGKFMNNEDWWDKYKKLREEKTNELKEAYGGEIPPELYY